MRSIHSIHPTLRKIILGVFFAAASCMGGFAFARAQGMGDPVIIRGDVEIFTVMDDWVGGESGVELAVQQWGSLLGHSIKIHSVGAGCESGITPEDVDKFVRQNNPLIVIGPSCSHTAFDIAKPLSDRKVLTISPSATDANLTGSSYLLHPFFLRTAPNDVNEGRIGARWANEVLKAPSAGIFFMDSRPGNFSGAFPSDATQT